MTEGITDESILLMAPSLKWQDAIGLVSLPLFWGGMADMPLPFRIGCFVLCGLCILFSIYSHKDWPLPIRWVLSIVVVSLVLFTIYRIELVRPSIIIRWSKLSAISTSTPLTKEQLNASAWSGGNAVAGEYVYQPTFGATLPAGTQTLRVSFTPTDTRSYLAREATIAIVVNAVETGIAPTPSDKGPRQHLTPETIPAGPIAEPITSPKNILEPAAVNKPIPESVVACPPERDLTSAWVLSQINAGGYSFSYEINKNVLPDPLFPPFDVTSPLRRPKISADRYEEIRVLFSDVDAMASKPQPVKTGLGEVPGIKTEEWIRRDLKKDTLTLSRSASAGTTFLGLKDQELLIKHISSESRKAISDLDELARYSASTACLDQQHKISTHP